MDDFLPMLIGALIGLLITLYIAKSVFRVNRIARTLEMQTRMLGEIAEKHGVPRSTIDKIIKEIDNSQFP